MCFAGYVLSFFMEMVDTKVIAEYKDKVDGIYLFGNDRVINFYPKFSFFKGKEYQCSKTVNIENGARRIEHVNMADMSSRQKFLDTVKSSACNDRFSMNNFGLMAFWTMGPMSNIIYYNTDEDAYTVAEIDEQDLWLHQIISARKVNLENIINSFGSAIKKVYLGFTPYDANGYEIKEFHEEDCTFFYLGRDLENIEKKKLMFPTLSHA